jgi:hypothetical protein
VKYLYGDSTPSPLQSNFLAFLRDALGFCVHLLQAQERITGLRADGRALDTAAEAERARIAGLRALVLEAAESANTDGPDSASYRAVARVKAAAEQGISTTLAEVASKLAAEHAHLAAKERTERDGCLDALGEFLAGHEPHEGASKVAVQLGDTGGYAGECSATTSYGIDWTCALEFSAGHAMAGLMKVGDAMPQMELSLPEAGGWLKKGKVKPQRVDQYSVDAFSSGAHEARIALRATPRAPLGLDIVIVDNTVQILRAGAKDVRDAGCEVTSDDATKLLALRDKLLETVTAGSGLRRRVVSATIDDKPLGDVPDLNVVVERVIEFAAPIANEIQAHSLSPYELVIRRLLGNDRREEVFVTSASLLDKLTPLTADQRAVFAPLNLKRVRPRTPVPGEEQDEEPGIVRTRIRAITPVAFAAHPPPSAHAPAVLVEPEPDPAPRAAATVTSPPINVDSEPSGPNGTPAAGDSVSGDGGVAIDATTKDALAATVKRIVGAARAGRTVEAFEAYAALFEDPDFAQQRPQDQRQVLKLMVMAKTPPPPSPMVVEALRSALSRLKALSTESADPVDAEMMQVCQGLLARAPE